MIQIPSIDHVSVLKQFGRVWTEYINCVLLKDQHLHNEMSPSYSQALNENCAKCCLHCDQMLLHIKQKYLQYVPPAMHLKIPKKHK